MCLQSVCPPLIKDHLQNHDAFKISKIILKLQLFYFLFIYFFCDRTLPMLTDQQTKTSEGPASSPHSPSCLFTLSLSLARSLTIFVPHQQLPHRNHIQQYCTLSMEDDCSERGKRDKNQNPYRIRETKRGGGKKANRIMQTAKPSEVWL